MYKNLLINLLMTLWSFEARAQIAPLISLLQPTMTPFQATALPYNHLDKFARKPGNPNAEKGNRETQKLFKGCYSNLSTRSEVHPQTGTGTSIIVSFDKIADPDKLKYKLGGGVMYNELQGVSLISPFFNLSIGKTLGDDIRLLGGIGVRYSQQRLDSKEWVFKDLDDPKIAIADQRFTSCFYTAGLSAAWVHIKKMYVGIAVNRIMSGQTFRSVDNSSFTEANLLIQYAYKRRYNQNIQEDRESEAIYESSMTENPNRGFLTSWNCSLAARYLVNAPAAYPRFYTQFNVRTTISAYCWLGTGWNTAKRWQAQFGLVKIPVFKQDASTQEYQGWIAYDIPTAVNPRHGFEVNLGYYF